MENERGAAKWHIASVSWGKDSLAMLLLLIEKSWPLDEVVFYDTGMEFQAIYDTQDRMLPELERLGIKYTRLEPETRSCSICWKGRYRADKRAHTEDMAGAAACADGEPRRN